MHRHLPPGAFAGPEPSALVTERVEHVFHYDPPNALIHSLDADYPTDEPSPRSFGRCGTGACSVIVHDPASRYTRDEQDPPRDAKTCRIGLSLE